jgi:hypothetical protein
MAISVLVSNLGMCASYKYMYIIYICAESLTICTFYAMTFSMFNIVCRVLTYRPIRDDIGISTTHGDNANRMDFFLIFHNVNAGVIVCQYIHC